MLRQPAVGAKDRREHVGVITHDAVNPSHQQPLHLGAIVDGPNVDREADTLSCTEQVGSPLARAVVTAALATWVSAARQRREGSAVCRWPSETRPASVRRGQLPCMLAAQAPHEPT